jgi:hypothetical protein
VPVILMAARHPLASRKLHVPASVEATLRKRISVSEISSALVKCAPLAVRFWMAPPVQVGVASVQTPPSPTTRKPTSAPAAEVLVTMMPFAPPLALTVVSVMLSGVRLLSVVPTISTATLFEVVSVPLLVVSVAVFDVAWKAR